MIHLNGLFGHWQTWALLAGAWLGIAMLVSVVFGTIDRVGAWRERGSK